MQRNSRKLIRLLEADGWILDRISGDHHIFKKLGFSSHINVPHPKKDLPIGLVRRDLKDGRLGSEYRPMKTYFAFILKDEDSAYGIVFPDIPGCFSAGDTYDEAVRNASEALQVHVESLRDNGKPVPEPRSFEALMADPELRADASDAPWIAVPLHHEGDTIEVSIPFEPELLSAMDAAAKQSRVSRSVFLAQAAREKIAG